MMPDFDNCECRMLPEDKNECKQECPDFLGLILDEEKCECVEKTHRAGNKCSIEVCPNGSSFNQAQCRCIQLPELCDIKCPEFLGLKLDEDICKCIPMD